MRFKVTVLLAVIFSVIAAAGFYAASAVLDPVSLTQESFFKGFNGIPWGADIRSLKDMVLISEYVSGEKPFASYRRKGDPLRFGKLKVRSVTYKFTNGKFSSCFIPLPSRKADPDASEYTKFYNEIDRIFGDAMCLPLGGGSVYWLFPKLEIILELWGTADPNITLDQERELFLSLNSPIYGTPQSPYYKIKE